MVNGTPGWGPHWYTHGDGSQFTGGSLALRQSAGSTSCPRILRRAPSPGLWDRNAPEGHAGKEGKHSDKWSQMPVCCSCRRLHDRGRQLRQLPGSTLQGPRQQGPVAARGQGWSPHVRAAGEALEGQAPEVAVRRGGGLRTETPAASQKARDSNVFQNGSGSQGQTPRSPHRWQLFCSPVRVSRRLHLVP